MNTTNKTGAENTSDIGSQPLPRKMRLYTELDSNGHLVSRKLTAYECQLEDDVEHLQEALFTISSQYAKIQFRLRQISSATACEKNFLLKELEDMAAQGMDGRDCRESGELPSLRCDSSSLGNVRAKQQKIICQLRGRLKDLSDATGACFQADISEWTSPYSKRITPFGVTDRDNGKPKERYLCDTSAKSEMQCFNTKLKYDCRGRPKTLKRLDRSDTRLLERGLSSHAVRYHSQVLNNEDNLLTLRKKREKQM